jgi:hypothetical protein
VAASAHTATMTDAKRFAVPLEELDAVHVAGADLVEAQPLSDLRWAAGGGLVHPFGDGATPEGDGE